MSDAWADEVPLYIWSGGERANLEPIKAAKDDYQRIHRDDVALKVRPINVTSLADLPNLDARVLAIGSRPPFVCNYALVSETTDNDGYVRALLWLFGGNDYHDPKAVTIEDVLNSTHGPGFHEIPEEHLEAERKARDYQEFR